MQENWRGSVIRLALLIAVAAVCSLGFHHPDEHFQVLEFLSFKLGKTPEHALAWEYPEAMRSFLQPSIYYVLVQGLSALGIQNPFTWTLFLRILSGLLTLAALTALSTCFLKEVSDARLRRYHGWLLSWLYFLPYLAVRTSSETLSSAFVFLGAAILWNGKQKRERGEDYTWTELIACGLTLGLGFQFRFPSALMSAGLVLWALIFVRLRVTQLLVIVFSGILPSLMALLIDKWGYGYFTVPAWNYFSQNLIQGASEQFGTDPFFAYLYIPSRHLLAPLTLLLTLLTLLSWWRNPQHPLTWLCTPYVLVHCLIEHKEMRFIFPVGMLAPLLVPLAFTRSENSGARLTEFLESWIFVRPSRYVLFTLNLLALLFFTLLPPTQSFVLQRFIFSRNQERFSAVLFSSQSPYEPVVPGLPTFFFNPRELQIDRVPSYAVAEQLLAARGSMYFIDEGLTLSDPQMRQQCQLEWRMFPPWVESINLFNWLRSPSQWALYFCRINGGSNATAPE